MWWLGLVPSIFCSLLALIIVLRFPLTEAKMTEVRRQLDARRAAASREQETAAAGLVVTAETLRADDQPPGRLMGTAAS